MVWLYCQEKEYHNYDKEGNKIGYKTQCGKFYNKVKCSYCGNRYTHWKDSLAYNYPDVAKMIAIPENNLTFDDCYNIACQSNKKFYFRCLKCNNISFKKYSLYQIILHGYSCRYCSDGISIPNKFIANILKQLKVNFITELSSKNFNEKKYFRYDFYLPKYNMIIEANGIQHYEKWTLSTRTLEQEQMNDLFKYKCVKNYVDDYIIIDCRYSELNWLKENIIKELSQYFDLSNVNWELAWEESQNSKVIEALKLKEEGYKIEEISKKINVTTRTIFNYFNKNK